jgi:uncharacterized protein (TIGR02996 family)
MTDDAFLRASIENPDDDGLRLMYADWLEERGDPRGEFIRVQVALAGMPEHDPRRGELEARERALLKGHRDEWLGPLRELAEDQQFHPGAQFCRGFVAELTVKASVFLEEAERLFRSAPVRRVCLLNAGDLVWQLANCPFLARLTGLGFWFSPIDVTGLQFLLASPYFGKLKELELVGADFGLAGVRALAGWSSLARLTKLDLGATHVSDDAVEALAASPYVRNLQWLGLSNNSVGVAGARTIASSPQFANLTGLELSYNYGFGDAGCEALAASPHLRLLSRLALSESEVRDRGVRALATILDSGA